MKKIGMILALVFSIILLTGCGGEQKKQLKCNKTLNENNVVHEEVKTVTINNYKLMELTEETVSTPSVEMISYLEPYKSLMDEIYEDLENKKGVTYSAKVEDNKYKLSIKFDYTKVDTGEFDNVNDTIKDYIKDVNNKVSIEKTKEELEAELYTCEYLD